MGEGPALHTDTEPEKKAKMPVLKTPKFGGDSSPSKAPAKSDHFEELTTHVRDNKLSTLLNDVRHGRTTMTMENGSTAEKQHLRMLLTIYLKQKDPQASLDGKSDADVTAVLKQFQKDNEDLCTYGRHCSDGIVGKRTWRAFERMLIRMSGGSFPRKDGENTVVGRIYGHDSLLEEEYQKLLTLYSGGGTRNLSWVPEGKAVRVGNRLFYGEPNKIDYNDEKVQAALSTVSARLNVPPEWIKEIIQRESSGYTNIVNSIGAVGIIQWTQTTARSDHRKTSLQIAEMSAAEQILLAGDYLAPKAAGKQITGIGDLYVLVFHPAAFHLKDHEIAIHKGARGYNGNKALDRNDDGISKGEIKRFVGG